MIRAYGEVWTLGAGASLNCRHRHVYHLENLTADAGHGPLPLHARPEK